jgi:hypothetical protein
MLQFIRSKLMKFQAGTKPSSHSQGRSAVDSLLTLIRRAYVSLELVDWMCSCAFKLPHCRSYPQIDQKRGFNPGFVALPVLCGSTHVQAASSCACALRLHVTDLAAISEKLENMLSLLCTRAWLPILVPVASHNVLEVSETDWHCSICTCSNITTFARMNARNVAFLYTPE